MADKNKKRNNNRNKDYDDDFNPKFKKMKKKVCPLCGDKNFVLDFKNSDQLRKFVNDKGKILPRRTTGACAKHQRDILLYYHMQPKINRLKIHEEIHEFFYIVEKFSL